MIYILIPSTRGIDYLGRLLKSLDKIKIPKNIFIIRNVAKERIPNKFYQIFRDSLGPGDSLNIKYIYKMPNSNKNNLGSVYKELFDSVPKDKYFLFLEDDDYIYNDLTMSDFELIRNKKLVLWFYKSEINNPDVLNWMRAVRYFEKYKDIKYLSEEFSKNSFQISCFMAKKIQDFNDFEWDNNLENDYKLFQEHLSSFELKDILILRKIMFVQGIGDNISFPKYNKDLRWQ